MRLIDADALMHEIADSIKLADKWAKESNENGDRRGVKCAIDARRSLLAMMSRVKDAPTIEAEPVRHGRWIEDRTDVICSSCGCRYNGELFCMSHEDDAFSRCPKCGAKMNGGSNMEKACFCCTVCSGFWNNGGECRGEVCECENPDECNEQKACYRPLTESEVQSDD